MDVRANKDKNKLQQKDGDPNFIQMTDKEFDEWCKDTNTEDKIEDINFDPTKAVPIPPFALNSKNLTDDEFDKVMR